METRTFVYVRAHVRPDHRDRAAVVCDPGDIVFTSRVIAISDADVVDDDWEGAALEAGASALCPDEDIVIANEHVIEVTAVTA